MVRVVLDANVVVSAAFGGIPLKALLKAFQHEVVISPPIKEELLRLPDELISKLLPEQRIKLRRWIKILIYKASLFHPSRDLVVCRDPKDNAYLSLCLDAQASTLVTGDADLLSISEEQLSAVGLSSLSILSPRRFLMKDTT
jgi:putative PIN family toxin of toxin-antitoxin system